MHLLVLRLTSHADSRQHLAAIEAEHLQRVPTFHKESVNRENVADDVLYKALMSVYWINSLYKCYFPMNNFLYYIEHFQAQFSNDLQMYTCRFVIVLLTIHFRTRKQKYRSKN